jgi:hypothetical protein
VNVTIYVEGGGDRESLKSDCRRAFRLFFERATPSKQLPKIVACGSRADAFDHFQTALRTKDSSHFPILLVDSEAPVTTGTWDHLKTRKGDSWDKPDAATDEQAHLMVQCMESWFLADVEALKKYFGSGFKAHKLKSVPALESVSKDSVFKQLADATVDTKTKGRYDSRSKGRHSFEILAIIDPNKVRKCCPHAERVLKCLEAKLDPKS